MRLIEVAATFMGMSALLLLPVAQAAVVEIVGGQHLETLAAKEDFLVVEFFAPWCGHCKNLAPEYHRASDELKHDGIVLASCDMTLEENKPLGEQFQIKGFPTLKMFRGGKVSDYTGPREADGIVQYLRGRNAPAFTVASTEAEVAEAISAARVGKRALVVAALDDENDLAQFKAAAEIMRDRATIVITSGALAHALGAKAAPAIAVYPADGSNHVTSTAAVTEESVMIFVKDSSMPSFGKIARENSDVMSAFVETKRLKLILLIEGSNDADFELVHAIPDVLTARGLRSDFFVGWIDGETFEQALQHFGVSRADLPTAILLNDAKDAKYVFDGKWDKEEIGDFAAKGKQGKLEPFYKSEDVVDNTNNNVWTVVRKNLDDVIGGKTDVLLKVYAPWCGHCKAMAPAFAHLGEALRDEKRVVIAKIDGSANDIPALFGVRGFPTLLWFKKDGGGVPTVYEGDRDYKGMIAYVRAHATESDLIVSAVDPATIAGGEEEEAAAAAPKAAASPVEQVYLALNAKYALGVNGWTYVGLASVLALAAVIMLIAALRESPAPAQPKKKAGTSSAPAAAAAAAASTPSKETDSKPAAGGSASPASGKKSKKDQ